jgi:response regulator RpfG family c-di-GMP phosphodiesterase
MQSRNNNVVSNQRLADRLMAEGLLRPDGHATVMAHVGLHNTRVEDCVVELGLMSEADLLRYVSTMHGTRFVSTEKLYKAGFDPNILQLVPRKLAEQGCVFPVMVDEVKRSITVVTPDPQDLQMLNEVKVAAGVREVTAIVGRPATVRAAIARAYQNDPTPFASLMRGGPPGGLSVQRFGSNPDEQVVVHTVPVGGRQVPNMELSSMMTGVAVPVATSMPAPAAAPALAPPPPPPPAAPPSAPAAPPAGPAAFQRPSAAPRIEDDAARRTGRRAGDAPEVPAPPVTLTTDYVETLNVMITLLENSRPDLRGHSAQCARLVKRICDRMGLPPAQTVAYVVAAYLHDIGKAGTYHLTALNVSEYDGHRTAAQKVFNVPDRFLQAVGLHTDTKSAVKAMYERFDGRGFPLGVGGKDIPLGGRILAVADSYIDITVNPRNPARRQLSPSEAVAFLDKHRGTVFDPTILDIVKTEVAGENLRAKILAERNNVLLVDPDPEDSTILELRLIEAGFDVRLARTYQQAVHELKSREFSTVISEVDLDADDAGLSLRSAAAGEDWGQRVMVWIIHTRKTDRQLAEIVFELGVDDLVSKPTPAEVLVTKLRQLIERKRSKSAAATKAPRGVSGSLAEMGLPDVIQILWHGRKTCTVRIKAAKGAGDIGFSEGQIVDARYAGKRGEDAFYSMLAIKDGDFHIDADAVPTERTIDVSPEGLLLEGMRRLDEGLV